jgi:predicted permease
VIVMSATGLLLLLGCVNVANLLLARGAARAREMAVRVAIGAPRSRIIRQLLTESVLLATCGAVLGFALAWLGVRALLALGASKLPRLDAVSFDGRVLLFSLVALVVSGLLVGFAPALRLAATDVRTLMSESTRSASGGRGTARWLSTMTVIEIALAILLVAGAGWLVRGFANLRTTDLGFAADQRLIFDVSFLGPKYPNPDAVVTASQTLMDRLAALPGVTGVGSTSSFPLRNTLESSLIAAFHGHPVDPAHPMGTRQRLASAGYFQATGTRLLQGRDFGPDDRRNTRAVAIVNRTFVKRYLNGSDPIGLQFSAGYPDPDPSNEVIVIGVVDDVRQKTVADEAEPAFYQAMSQNPLRRQTVVVATSARDTGALQSAIRGEMRGFDPQVAVEFELVRDLVDGTLRRQQLGMTLMLIFGSVAVLLAAIGIYGVVAYAVSQRRGEMATRLALGATPGSVFLLVMRQGALLALTGTAIGLFIAYLSGRIVASQIYAIRASDPLMLGAAIVLVAGITALATMIPAWRASRLAPSGVLHTD